MVAPGEGTLVVYSDVARHTVGPVLKGFTEQSGIQVRVVYRDREGEGFYDTLRAEAAAGRVDLYWGETPLHAIELARAGLAEPFRPVGARPVPSQYRDPLFRWIGFAVNPRVIIYNTRLVERAEAPLSIEDMVRAPWAGKGVMARIHQGTPAFHAAALFSLWGDEDGRAFFERMAANGTLIVEDDNAVRDAVVAGKALWGLIDLDEAICANREAEPLHIFFPDRTSLGAVVAPQVAVLLRGAPSLPQAKGLFAWLFTVESGYMLSQNDCALVTLLPDVPKPDWVPSLGMINITPIDNDALYDAFVARREYFASWGAVAPSTP